MKKSNRIHGFTVIELMVAMAIAAVMLSFALPAFNDFTTQRRMATNVNAMIAALNYARSEAARLGGTVSVQAVDASQTADEWGDGFCVTAGTPGDCTTPLQVFSLDGLDGNGTFDAIDGLHTQGTISYNSRGLVLGGLTGSIQLCGNDADDDPGRVININAIGRASIRELTCFP